MHSAFHYMLKKTNAGTTSCSENVHKISMYDDFDNKTLYLIRGIHCVGTEMHLVLPYKSESRKIMLFLYYTDCNTTNYTFLLTL